MEPVKDPLNLVRAISILLRTRPELREHIGLIMIGDGSLKPHVQQLLDEAGLSTSSWLPGARDDVPQLMQRMNLFVLPSLAEGISNTILEAMASGLPIVATDVGGNGELVASGQTGVLVERADELALARAIEDYVVHEHMREEHGIRARTRTVREFSIDIMINRYAQIYESAVARLNRRRRGARNSTGK
jgi:glycosyltransferase involved in cell wall biosynthesis